MATTDESTVLTMDDGGQLVALTGDVEWWRSEPMRGPGGIAFMQDDGNLVIYPSAERTSPDDAVWASNSRGAGAHLVVGERRGGGWIAIVDSDDNAIWQREQFPPVATTPPPSSDAPTTTVVTEVPDVEGNDTTTARALLEAEPYNYQVTVQQQSDPSIAAGVALGTVPAAGTPLRSGSSIKLLVSSGTDVTVPDVEGLTEASARNTLTTMGLLAQVTYVSVPAGDASDGLVRSQDKPPGQRVPRGTTVRLSVGKAVPIG